MTYSPAYVQPVQYRDPAFAYTADPNYRNYSSAPGYDAYAYDPYYRPYYTRPGFSVGVGPFGFGLGF